MSETALIDLGRLTFRVEGEWIVCRWAPNQHHMADAIEYGRLLKAGADNHCHIWEKWEALMREMFADIVEHKTGTRPKFDPAKPAPEYEKAGRA